MTHNMHRQVIEKVRGQLTLPFKTVRNLDDVNVSAFPSLLY